MSDSDSSSSEDQPDLQANDGDEPERQKIRENLSTMSFQDLINLKEKLGSKVYNEALFGQPKTQKKAPKQLKRSNKNKPREISSKIKPRQIRALLKGPCDGGHKKAVVAPRDPRFDPSCGEFDKSTFKQDYQFIRDLRQNEKLELQKELRECKDPERKKTIKMLIQRIENQLREEDRANKEKQKEDGERVEMREKLKQGEKRVFKKKSVKKLEDLVEKYEELKKTNRLQKHIQKRTKKLKVKDRKVMAKIK